MISVTRWWYGVLYDLSPSQIWYSSKFLPESYQKIPLKIRKIRPSDAAEPHVHSDLLLFPKPVAYVTQLPVNGLHPVGCGWCVPAQVLTPTRGTDQLQESLSHPLTAPKQRSCNWYAWMQRSCSVSHPSLQNIKFLAGKLKVAAILRRNLYFEPELHVL